MFFLVSESIILSITLYLWFLAIISLFSFRRNTSDSEDSEELKKFLIIIPAHNESLVIEKAIRSINQVKYSKDLYDFVVIADNCQDDTIDRVLKDERAICLIREDNKNMGKGYALRWAFQEIKKWKRSYDAFVIMDADSQIDPDFLAVMNRKLSEGNKVLQGMVQVINPERSPVASLIFLGWSLNQRLRHMGTSRLGYFGFLLGNGICIRTEIIDRHGWNATSILEDVEYGVMMRLAGLKIGFIPDAKIYAQNPSSFRYAESQRIRWDQGRFLIMKKYVPELLKGSIIRRDFSLLFSALELLIPPYTLLVSFISILFFIYLLTSYRGADLNLFLWISIFSVLSCYSITGLIVSKANLKVWMSILYVPVFMIWRMLINIKGCFHRGSLKWIRTERENLQ